MVMTPKAFIEHVLSIAATEPSAVLTELRSLVQTSIITKPVVGLVLQQIVSGLGALGLDDLSRLVLGYWKETAALRGVEEAVTLRHIMRAKGELRSALLDVSENVHRLTLRSWSQFSAEALTAWIRPPVETWLDVLGLEHDVKLRLDVWGNGGQLILGSAEMVRMETATHRSWSMVVAEVDIDGESGSMGHSLDKLMLWLDPLELLDRGAFDRQWRDRDMSEEDLGAIVEALREAGPFHYGDEDDLLEVALEWLREGFTGAEVEAWTAYPIEDPSWARRLKDRDICPHGLDEAAQDITGDAWMESGSSMATFKRETIYRLAELIVERGFTLEDAREDLFYIAELERSDYVTGRVLG